VDETNIGQTNNGQTVGQKLVYLKSGPLKASEVALSGEGLTVYARF
jgi:hypothetical protein